MVHGGDVWAMNRKYAVEADLWRRAAGTCRRYDVINTEIRRIMETEKDYCARDRTKETKMVRKQNEGGLQKALHGELLQGKNSLSGEQSFTIWKFFKKRTKFKGEIYAGR